MCPQLGRGSVSDDKTCEPMRDHSQRHHSANHISIIHYHRHHHINIVSTTSVSCVFVVAMCTCSVIVLSPWSPPLPSWSCRQFMTTFSAHVVFVITCHHQRRRHHPPSSASPSSGGHCQHDCTRHHHLQCMATCIASVVSIIIRHHHNRHLSWPNIMGFVRACVVVSHPNISTYH